MQPTIGRRAFVPTHLLDPDTVRKARKSLLFSETDRQRVHQIISDMIKGDDELQIDFVDGEAEKVTVNEYKKVRGGVSLPRAWARKNLKHITWQDATVFPLHGIKLGKGPSPRDAKQLEFFQGILNLAKAGQQDILTNADTGVGKSVAGIWIGHQLKTRTLIVVDQNKIANGWLKNFRKFYGDAWTEKNVGRAQQDLCEWEDKAFTIALVQSLARRDYGADFYNAFGCVIYDEIQVFGSPHYAKVLHQFPARVRIGFTAENRAGAFGRLIKTHVGETSIVSKQEALKTRAYLIRNTIRQTFYCMSDGAILTGLSRIADRNRKLASLIKRRGYDRDRQVLVLSDRTAHLYHLRRLLIDLGVPASVIGMHCGSYMTDRLVISYSYNENGNKQKLWVVDDPSQVKDVLRKLKRGEHNEFNIPKALAIRLQKGERVFWHTTPEEYVPSQIELDNITNSCQIILATYQIFSKGIDVPRLDMGVEALPSGNVKQPLGRIRRTFEGKPQPEWYAIVDTVELEGAFKSNPQATIINTYLTSKTETRIKALQRAKAQIVYS